MGRSHRLTREGDVITESLRYSLREVHWTGKKKKSIQTVVRQSLERLWNHKHRFIGSRRGETIEIGGEGEILKAVNEQSKAELILYILLALFSNSQIR